MTTSIAHWKGRLSTNFLTFVMLSPSTKKQKSFCAVSCGETDARKRTATQNDCRCKIMHPDNAPPRRVHPYKMITSLPTNRLCWIFYHIFAELCASPIQILSCCLCVKFIVSQLPPTSPNTTPPAIKFYICSRESVTQKRLETANAAHRPLKGAMRAEPSAGFCTSALLC